MRRSVGGRRLLCCDVKRLSRSRRLNRLVLPCRGRTHQPVESGVAVARSRVTPANGFSIVVGKESVDPIVLDLVCGLATTLSLSFVCEMIEGAVTVRPVRIVRECNTVEEQ